ncbi:SPOR domain-containing protein [Yoonia sp.]|uniref:SPOR domain-containing protein n=1 Tax=Yoonia sp. TaxID=2212373 RepID=UPI0019F22294|nr:SPOR domain-containing protein [Yoonia sp.]MBE0412841.1 SPOR domain-containing protein [Yoonia sp.]
MAVYDEGFTPHSGALRAGSIVNYAGAALSLALMAGVGFWGYKLIIRDVSGIPVVRAMEGDMRVLPDNPGGDVALNTGLAVNEVAAVGEAGGPEDLLVLAPMTMGLSREDLDVEPAAEAQEMDVSTMNEMDTEIVMPAGLIVDNPPVIENDGPSDADILALADQIAVGTDASAPSDGTDIVPASVPGVALSPRPVLRPMGLQVAMASPVSAAPSSTQEVAVTTTEFAPGTNLVQLGAFPSPTLAASEWAQLERRFGRLLDGKSRVIQVSNQSSGTWYRLRASGFADRDEARRFCTALEAEGANCIAVLVN